MPLPDNLERQSSIVLFLRSARRARAGFELNEETLPHVARICQLVQGMPLAILLAAAWVPALTPDEIASEMERSLDFLAAEWRDEPQRHHSMRAVFDATWVRLTDTEQEAFARLSVFRGGFARKAAQAVAEADLRTFISLVNKSLVQRDRTGRYQVHELVRQYGEEKLDERPEEKEHALNLHCAYYAELLDRKKTEIDRGYHREMLPELDNIRAAWQHAVAHRLVAKLSIFLDRLAWLYYHQGLSREANVALGQAVDAVRSRNAGSFNREAATVLGNLLARQGFHAFLCGHMTQATQLFCESEEILRDLGEQEGLAEVLVRRAVCGAVDSDAEAERLLQEALAIWRKSNKQTRIPLALNSLGEQAIRRGAYHEAERYCQEALKIGKSLDHRKIMGWALNLLGYVAYAQGEYARAKQFLEREQSKGSGVERDTAFTWYLLGQVVLALGEYEDAARYYQEALSGFKELKILWQHSLSGICRGSGLALVRLGDVALAMGDMPQAGRRYAQALRVAADEPHPEFKLEAVLGQAKLLAQREHVASWQERAAELATLVLCHPDGLRETQDAAQRLLDGLQVALDPEVMAAAQKRGRARDLDATVQALLDELRDDLSATSGQQGKDAHI